jgi:hypothetical protein
VSTLGHYSGYGLIRDLKLIEFYKILCYAHCERLHPLPMEAFNHQIRRSGTCS